jgi:predicted ATP-grasp superfamily ATP-dependent carboligase
LAEQYDILILDGSHKHSLTSARSLARAGLRVALAEAAGQYPTEHKIPAFVSRYCSYGFILPDYVTEPAKYVDDVLAFTREHGVKVVMPVGDANITLLAPHREKFKELGSFLAVASDAALEVANDKTRTLEVAAKLDIAYPKSVPINAVEDLSEAEKQFGYPFVLKPTVSWTGQANRSVPVEVVNAAEAREAAAGFL